MGSYPHARKPSSVPASAKARNGHRRRASLRRARSENSEKHLSSGGVRVKNYVIIIEKAERNFSAYCPDLPGCVAAAKTRLSTEKLMREAIALHLEAMREDGIEPPASTSSAAVVSVSC
jgi:predicted RNase H-like HicB family nuclease